MNDRMKLKFVCFSVLVFVFALMGCTPEEIYNALKGYPTMKIDPYIMNNSSASRIVEEEGNYYFSEGDSLALVVFTEGYSPNRYEEGYIQTASFDGSVWRAELASDFQPESVEWKEINELKWKALGDNFEIYAYTPDVKQVLEWPVYQGSVSLEQNIEKNFYNSDFLFGKVVTQRTSSYLSIPMEHKLSMLTVKIEASDSLDTGVEGISVTAYPDFWMHFLLDEVYCSRNVEKVINAYSSGDSIFSVILPAQKISEGQIVLSMNDGTEKTLQVDLNMEFENNHIINVLCEEGGLFEVVDIETIPWGMPVGSDENGTGITEVYDTGDVIVYQKKRIENPVTMVVTGDGYTKEDLLHGGEFEKQARAALDFLFDVEPYKTYRDYFNVYIIPALSKERGADNYTTGSESDTYFNSGWNDDCSVMWANDVVVTNFVQTFCPDIVEGRLTLDDVPVCLLVNDSRYGGICYSWSSGKSFAIVPTTEGTWKLSNNEELGISVCDWRNTFLHEYGGHSFGRLLDEYYEKGSGSKFGQTSIESHSWTVPLGLNITADTTGVNDKVYWERIIGDERFSKVGFYEGANTFEKGIWRSEVISAMDDNRKYFNAISRQIIVERIKEKANESFSFDDFCSKDVDYDELRDDKSRTVDNTYGIPEFPRTPSPVLMKQ